MQKQFYKCFSYNLKRFIEIHGIKALSSGVHPTTHKKYFVYEVDEELSRVLTIWTQNKQDKE